MDYASIPFLALAVHYIVNHSVIKNYHYNKNMPIGKSLRWLFLCMLGFMLFDCLWGILYEARLTALLCIIILCRRSKMLIRSMRSMSLSMLI